MFPDGLYFTIEKAISCQPTELAHYVNITFKNQKAQEMSSRLDIAVVYRKGAST